MKEDKLRCVNLNLRGRLFKIICSSERNLNLIDWIQDDFSALTTSAPISVIAEIQIVDEISRHEKKRIPFFINKSVKVFGWGKKKYYQHQNGCESLILFGPTHQIQIKGPDQAQIYEVLYLLILSLFGQDLEKEGWMRIHGMTLDWKNQAYLLVANPGLGKSLLAAKMMHSEESSSLKILGDEMVFIKKDETWSFPLRAALYPKIAQAHKIQVSERWTYRDGKALKVILKNPIQDSKTVPLKKIYFAKTQSEKWSILDSKFHWQAWTSLFWGRGLVQMLEYQIRFDNLSFLIKMAINRLKQIYFLEKKRTLKEICVGNIEAKEFKNFISR